MILCDTNVLIEFYKGNPAIVQELRQIGIAQLTISVISQAELYYGALNKAELLRIQKHLNLLHNLPINQQVSSQFIQLMTQYSLSHKLSIPDALIAATALVNDLELYTLNTKDFRFIESLKLYRF
ncbi:type II toxin-antitoxin system VapC family toxin [Geitlerinema sp. P-1104]|uniref:type II toxin-antitoxin system VapC family toxin n=1 Tax=Geitlerinema sp. P-1104 TaxID=2546230 RepID=UPI001476C1F3|nr:type II toxin-antitoxin system VapC family toxin [Geitlerinema sp. P-1104]NMG61253.1 type II toxin-antitoxin system VapC family toxin [Geitlerinema sp. P-1104]